ncbi:serine hydrolase domain-containing protein [Rhodococcus sp. NPDC003994]
MGDRVRRVVVMSVAAILVGGSVASAQVTDVPSLQDAVVRWSGETETPGLAAQIVSTEGVVDSAETGVDGHGAPIDDATPFVWGSVSKQLAAATVLQLQSEGLVALSDAVTDRVPQAVEMLGGTDVTVSQLIHHTSGLPHDVSVTDDWSRRGSATDTVATLQRPDGATPPGDYHYSSLNYLVLQAVVESVTDGFYADALRRTVLEPAGATDVVVDATSFTDTVPPGSAPFFWTTRTVDIGIDSAGWGYGYLAGSVGDLGRYATWRLDRLRSGEPVGDAVETGRDTLYGNGLFRERIDGHDVWWHAGAVPGYFAYVALVPDENRAMVLLANRYGELEADRLAAMGRNLTHLVLGGPTPSLPSSSAPGVLAALAAVIVALLLWAAIVMRGMRRGGEPRSRRASVVRIGLTIVVAAAVVIGSITAVPSVVGVAPDAMWRWAPDATVMFWALLGSVMAVAGVIVLREVAGQRRSGR